MANTIDIIVGDIRGVSSQLPRKIDQESGILEGKILSVRKSRSKGGYNSSNLREDKTNNRRKSNISTDPINSKVLTILIPDGIKLPDFSSGEYKVFIRFRKI